MAHFTPNIKENYKCTLYFYKGSTILHTKYHDNEPLIMIDIVKTIINIYIDNFYYCWHSYQLWGTPFTDKLISRTFNTSSMRHCSILLYSTIYSQLLNNILLLLILFSNEEQIQNRKVCVDKNKWMCYDS